MSGLELLSDTTSTTYSYNLFSSKPVMSNKLLSHMPASFLADRYITGKQHALTHVHAGAFVCISTGIINNFNSSCVRFNYWICPFYWIITLRFLTRYLIWIRFFPLLLSFCLSVSSVGYRFLFVISAFPIGITLVTFRSVGVNALAPRCQPFSVVSMISGSI